MDILLTNDDGIYAKGLWDLYRVLIDRHDVMVVAPDREKSAVSHGISLNQPLRIDSVEANDGYSGYAVNGTPADCVKLGMTTLKKTAPNIVISGINPGANVGVNIHYSGTVAAAREASLYGVAAISVSIDGRRWDNFADSARFVRSLAENVQKKGLPFGTCLNVNIPDLPFDSISGVRVSRLGFTPMAEFFEKRVDPRNNTYYWYGPDPQVFENHPDVDGRVLSQNYISITPIQSDATDYRLMDHVKSWGIGKRM